MRIRTYLTFFAVFLTLFSFAQQRIEKLTRGQIEAKFLEQNLELIAEKMNISVADAEIAQAKLWENPTFSLGDVNLWTTKAQRREEEVPALFGNFAKNTQFSVELSQLIQTARKRGKLISREKVSKEISIQEFEEVLRGLKVELRTTIEEIYYLQTYQQVLNQQRMLLKQLINSYKNQVQQGNIAKSELIRLQASLSEVNSEIYELQKEYNEHQKAIKSLLNTPPDIIIEVDREITETRLPEDFILDQLLEKAKESRPDVKIANLQIEYFDKNLSYEKAQRVPDLEFSFNYDRAGGIWKDYVGFGISMDIPLLNRNQGNIKIAQINKEQSMYHAKQQVNRVQHEVVEAYNNYELTYNLYKEMKKESLAEDLDMMLESYTRNFMKRNISLLEFIDYLETYKANKEIILSTDKNLATQFEELQYTVGEEIR